MIHLMALRNTPHSPFPVGAILIQGTPMSGWSWRLFSRRKRFFPKGLTLFNVKGGHAGMTLGEPLQQLAKVLRRCIDNRKTRDQP
jgi:hypothetical protein